VASEERQKSEHSRPTVYEWTGELVILHYTGGPFPQSPWEIEKGGLEARSALFGVDEVSELGVIVRKIREGGKLDDPLFIPWGSVLSMRVFSPSEPIEDTEKAGQPEPQ
jgi:hypothetical protein